MDIPINTHGENVVKLISALLSDAGVPSVLWGDYLLTIYGVPSIIGGIEFVIPDDKLPTAIAAFKKSSLLSCPDPQTCIVSGELSQTPAPAFHMHIEGSEVDISLRTHSETLWFIPPPSSADLEMKASEMSKAYYMKASDASLPGPRHGRGHGAFSPDGPPVIIPRAHILLEAYIRLASAFRKHYVSFFLSMVTYMEEYVDRDGFIDETRLSKPCRIFWDELKRDDKPVRELMNELQHGLGDGVYTKLGADVGSV
ncbi:uncharacterized protein F4807DRAFT_440190 [Annulohypoxylon truncatum]|uniref:uncharacterized protein n=1 Tax=Annulohypoxylon truncatum TaxID=327061 RepID=UPI002007B7FE|nr:uncharacterized protein F4807DRAFT_440190 [Annulohypoxylon truncatum]KAI1206186.1 hypothetical protein F4807DRAFT_440190 [Annulohypoxylon truncatum]